MADVDEKAPPSRLAELRASAKGWHGVQLAVIGFIGLCGVLQGGRPDADPGNLRVSVDGREVVVSLENVATVTPVDGC